jgi:diguanylate cyclase (GGDEF)-like protein/PAS domain S-box-containing protein
MKRASLLYRLPLSVTLSLLLLLGGALFMGAYLSVLWGAQREGILRDSTRALTGEITRQQRYLQEHLDRGDLRRAQDELAALGTDIRVRLALLGDTEGTVLAALRRADVDGPLAASLGAVDLDPLDPGLAATLAEVRVRRGARVQELPQAGLLLAAAPLDLPDTEARLGQREPGLLLIAWDLRGLYRLALTNTWAITQRFLPVLLVAALGAWGLLQLVLGRRLRRLAATAERIAGGEVGERSPVDGRDEIGRLAQAFNHMTDTLAAQRTRIADSEQRLSLAQSFAQMGSWEWDIATGRVTSTRGVYSLFDLEPGAPLTLERCLELIHPEDRGTVQTALQGTIEAGADYQVEVRTTRGDRWLLSRGDVLRGPDGQAVRMYGVVQDVSERKRAEEALFNEKERLLVTLASIGDGVVTTDTAERVTFLNPVAERLTGCPLEQARGRPVHQVFRVVNELTRRPCANTLSPLPLGGPGAGLANHTLLIRSDGHEYAIEHAAAPIRNREGETIGSVLTFRDVTGAREMANRLSWQASHDALTGLCNRVAFEERLHHLVHQPRTPRGPEVHTLLYIDLDRFKVVNDVAGHVAGDEVLKQISGLMQHQVRESDMLARIGGDEFGVILTHCDIAHAQRVADGIHQALEGFKFPWNERQFRFGASIGALEFSPGETSLTDLLRAADLACYAAKNSGRRRTHVYRIDDVHTQRHRAEMDWATRLSDAVDSDRLVLHAQLVRPLRESRLGEGLNFEVLVRMCDTDGTLILPAVFLPAAERFDLMTLIDRWIIARAFRTVAESLRESGRRIHRCALNLSGATLGDESLLPFIQDQLARHGLPAEIFCFEITETVAISNFPAALGLIRELRAMGCRFALDDFGSGLCSFAYLKNLPVDYLKIDGTFVRDLGGDAFNRALVGNINDIGHLLGKQTVAEYAEDAATIAILAGLGVDYAQGFGVAAPQPIEELLASTAQGASPAARADRLTGS